MKHKTSKIKKGSLKPGQIKDMQQVEVLLPIPGAA